MIQIGHHYYLRLMLVHITIEYYIYTCGKHAQLQLLSVRFAPPTHLEPHSHTFALPPVLS